MTPHQSTSQAEPTGQLVELAVDECWDLLRDEPVGRLAWNGARHPVVLPVNFAVAAGGIDIRTTAHSALAQVSEGSDVTFQVDRIDSVARTGWSVLAHGQVELDWIYGRVDAPGVDVWPSGNRTLTLHLEVNEISGRRLSV